MSDAPDVPPVTPSEPPPDRPLTEPSKDEKMWAMLAHLAGLIASALGGLSFLGPLIIWLIKKNESAFVDYHGKEALNFQLTLTIVLVVCLAITVLTCIGGVVAIPVMMAAGIYALVVSIMAAIKANNGEYYKYPITIRMIK